MKKQNNVFTDTISIETRTLFCQNGSVNIYPCPFEENHNIVADGDVASQKGRMVTLDDGTSRFLPYAVDSGSRYHTLFLSPHGEVKESDCGCCGEIAGTDIDCRVFEANGKRYEVPTKEMLANAILKSLNVPPKRREPYVLPENLKRFFDGKAAQDHR